MPYTFSEDEIINSISSLTASAFRDDGRNSSIPSTDSMPFADDLPAPEPTSKRNVPAVGYTDEPSAPVDDDPPPVYNKTSMDVACDIINTTLNSEEGQRALHAEIMKLGNSAAIVEECFRNVARGLEKTLEVAKTDCRTSEMKKFQEKWGKIHKTYVDLVWESRRVAGHARTIATDFAGDFLAVISDAKYSVAQKKKEIANYRAELEHDKANSAKLSQGFSDLESAVGAFKEDIKEYAATTDALRVKVEELIKRIEEIKVQLSKLTKETIVAAVVTLGLGAAAAGALAVGAICPPLWIGAAIGAYKTVKSGKQCWDKNNERRAASQELDEKKKDLADHQKSLEELEKISAILTGLDSDMDLIQAKLRIFTQIWRFVHTDLNEVEKLLDLASQTEIQDRFTKKIKAVSTIYKSLARALYWYETNVHIQKLQTPTKF